MSDLVPMNLWALAVRLCPCRSAAYSRWCDISPDTLSEACRRSVERADRHGQALRNGVSQLSLLERSALANGTKGGEFGALHRGLGDACARRDQWELVDWPLVHREKALGARANRLRLLAFQLITTDLPAAVKRALMSGRYRVSACRPEGERVTLAMEDLAGMTVNLRGNMLASRAKVFDMVAVSELDASEVSAPRSVSGLPIGKRPPLPAPEIVDPPTKGRTPVSKNALMAWLRDQPSRPLPSKDKMWRLAKDAFRGSHLPRADFNVCHMEVFGPQSPGPRGR